MTLADARQQIIDALAPVGLAIRPRVIRTPKPKDGWVTITRITPARFGDVNAVTFAVVVILNADLATAEAGLDQVAIPALNAISNAIACGEVSIEPQTFVTEQGGSLYGMTLTLTMEV